jgi:hypothetical protein
MERKFNSLLDTFVALQTFCRALKNSLHKPSTNVRNTKFWITRKYLTTLIFAFRFYFEPEEKKVFLTKTVVFLKSLYSINDNSK